MKKKSTCHAGLSFRPCCCHSIEAIQKGVVICVLAVFMTTDDLGQANPLRLMGVRKTPKTFQSTKAYAYDFILGGEVFVRDPCSAPITPLTSKRFIS